MKSVDIDWMLVEQNLKENIQESLGTLQSTETSPHVSPNFSLYFRPDSPSSRRRFETEHDI